jgi:hypothetical protein
MTKPLKLSPRARSIAETLAVILSDTDQTFGSLADETRERIAKAAKVIEMLYFAKEPK